jgi:hypothetical protein
MIKHVVMWKLKENAEGAGKRENALKMKSQLEALRGQLPQIRSIEVGVNTAEGPDAYDVVLVSEFADMDELQAYQKAPEHLKVADFIGKVRLERKVVDYSTVA